jgi:hypothetical protein
MENNSGGIAVIASIMTVGTYGAVFADPQHFDRSGWPSCYSVGFQNGQANPGGRFIPDRENNSSTSDVGSGKGTLKVTVEIFVSPRLSFDQKPTFSVTINDQQQGTEVHITENDERPVSQQISDPMTSASTEFVTSKRSNS